MPHTIGDGTLRINSRIAVASFEYGEKAGGASAPIVGVGVWVFVVVVV